jgi:hypothetical protein
MMTSISTLNNIDRVLHVAQMPFARHMIADLPQLSKSGIISASPAREVIQVGLSRYSERSYTYVIFNTV